ncbi:MAG: hypothetical protein ACE5JM_11875 [Armatimonadota bacterium]
MPQLHITDMMLRDLIRAMAPLVATITGWELDIASLGSRVLPKDRGYEEIVLGWLRGAGIPVDDDEPRTLIARLVEYVVEANVLGAYQPSPPELLIVRENVDDSNMDGLRLVVAHELVHRGQHVNHGHLFDRVDEVAREVFRRVAHEGAGISDARHMLEQVQETMTLLESHAAYVQAALHRSLFPDAQIESHFSLPALLLRLFAGRKTSQYTEGLPAIAAAAASGDIESLYSSL